MTKLLFRERPRFAVDCAVCALPAGGDISADAIQAFPDETGHFHAVLCDGMGTGKAAAVGGVLAALSALAGLALLVGIFAGFSWSLSMGIAALGFGMDSLFCALESMRTARG